MTWHCSDLAIFLQQFLLFFEALISLNVCNSLHQWRIFLQVHVGADALCEVNMCFQRESFIQSHINVRCGSGDFSSYLSHPQTPTSWPPIYYTRNKGRGVGWLWRSLKQSVLHQRLPHRLQRRMVSPLYMNQSRRTMQQVCFGFWNTFF